MIITRLAGGIGNQMFQYAIARKNQRTESEPIVLDASLLEPLEADVEKIVQRPFALNVFSNLRASMMSAQLAELLSDMRLPTRIRRKLFKARTQQVRQLYLEPVGMHRRRFTNLWLQGNFQSEKHFSGMRSTLLQDFKFPVMDAENERLKARIVDAPQAISIHLRRGDYLSSSNKGIFDSLTPDYYIGALQKVTRKVPLSDMTGFVFSDDIPWAKANFAPSGLRLEYIRGNEAHQSWKDMNLMSACRHHIIANSSFSWWGAWLSQRAGENTAPRHWFRPNTYPYEIDHIVPPHWQVVDYGLS